MELVSDRNLNVINNKKFFNQNKKYNFKDVLNEVQNFMANKYASLLRDNEDKKDKSIQIKSYIKQFLISKQIEVDNLSQDELVNKLYRDMAEYSFLTDYLKRNDIEEININAWNNIKILYSDGEVKPSDEIFISPDHAVDVVRRLLRKSNMILDNSNPIARGHLSKNIRITVLGGEVIDDDVGVVASIRIVNPKKLGKEDFIKNETGSIEMIESLEQFFKYGVSMCIAGSTNCGKTTLMAWLLSTISDDKRIYTIENDTREFDLVKKDKDGKIINSVIHTVTRHNEDKYKNIDQEKLLETALTSNPDYICVGEMKGSESFSAQESARTGHTVITTTHANSCDATYPRMVTLCKTKYDMEDKTLYELVTEAFPIVFFVKRLEDNSRKIMEIKECIIHEDGRREKQTLFKYEITSSQKIDGKTKITGEFKRVNNISEQLQQRLLENGMPTNDLKKLVR
ncbi:ATPase, T2SS/T4P/T4SS family [Paraclostridium sordellii]|uniref:ATPase, T2SS/T4P/T4SS family n=1 Tax=Paraclostridium sordellii TaxID=1505 RepID=UPI000E478100|nr:ATPase, T2SS/T4P/T4SS family [Paeniclostridium sordellii]RGX09354.1 CpaF family protein [Paeniclostridium sordellii]